MTLANAVMESAGEPAISVVIPVRNEGQRIKDAVDSIVACRSSHLPLQIVLVDDASSDGCCNSLPNSYSWSRDYVQIDLIRLPRWSGIPFARNTGAFAARSGILFITDANVRFPAGWDIPIREHISANRVLCATVADLDSSFRGFGCTLHLQSMAASWLRSPISYGGYLPIAPCSATIIPADLFRRAGGYDTAMPVYGAAEPEFSVRLWLGGAEIVSLPNLVLQHRFRPASEQRRYVDAIRLVEVHNYVRFALLYLDRPGILRTLQYYATTAPRVFEKAIRQVWAGDVWKRRDLLQRTLPARFDFFVRRFGLRDSRDELGVQ